MSLSRPVLALGAGPRVVADARRWVVGTVAEMGRDDLTETAELGVSELVTNALLHGSAPIQVAVRGTREHPRIEVRDASPERPVMPHSRGTSAGDHRPGNVDLDTVLDDLDLEGLEAGAFALATVGRGLDMVARCSEAWGADIEEDGKVVWFSPATQFAEDEGVAGVVSDLDLPRAETIDDPVTVHLLGAPGYLVERLQRHVRELRREVRLLGFSYGNAYPAAATLADLFPLLVPLTESRYIDAVSLSAAGRGLDLSVVVSRGSALAARQAADLLDKADDFCRQEELLTLHRDDQLCEFQDWYLDQFAQQAAGHPAAPWQVPVTDPHASAC
ncbi:ATP-binding protein [Nocardioides acrostichi]|uniref:ATP-binding protein n=1 Tax=Nocardioides acrostichi TaxID=2784339 RepID=A0A930UZM1_9ACTN|nr:ATP-binding protein [Nocardioides acrostichi]MBF4163828.1 ATP-binding protein [Nocardioides acrostichi]